MSSDSAEARPAQSQGPSGWSGKTRGGLIGNAIFVSLVRWGGLRAGYLLLVPVCFYFLLASPKAFRASWKYFRRLPNTGQFSRSLRLWMVYRHFFTFGQILLDKVALMAGDSRRWKVDFDDETTIRDCLKGGRGVVLLTAHCGGWEVACHASGRFGRPVRVVALQGEVERIRKYFNDVLGDRTFSVIAVDGSPGVSLEIVAALNAGEIVAMMGDRSWGADPRWTKTVGFLGEEARFPVGPFLVAQATGAPLVEGFVARLGCRHYRFITFTPEKLKAGDHNQRPVIIDESMRRFVRRLEGFVGQYRYQWFNFFDFWKGVPHGDS